MNRHKLAITFFEDEKARKKSEVEWTLSDLAEEILIESAPTREALPWLKLATFGEVRSKRGNSLRNKDNVLAISGVELDYDAGKVTFDEGVALVKAAGLRALVYTTPSYKKGEREKWRVLCPTSVQMPPAARFGLVAVLKGVIGGGIDDASFRVSQSFYYGSVNGNPDHRVKVVEGDFIDLRPDLAAGAIGPDPKAMDKTPPEKGKVLSIQESPSYSDAEIDAMLDKTQYSNSDGSGNWHPNMLAVTGALVGRGLGNDAIGDRVGAFCIGGRDDPEMLAMVASAREKWGIPDPDIPAGAKLGDALAAIKRDAPEAVARALLVEPMWRERNKGGNPVASFHNTQLAIEALKIRCSKDVFHGKMYVGRSDAASPGEPLLPFYGEVTDASIGALRGCLSDTWGLDFGEKHVWDAVNLLCNENQFNPVVDMLAEAEASWDGVARLDRMAIDHFNAADTPLNRQMVRKVMIAAVARARQPGCKFDTILVMESPEGLNKSSAWAVLAGEGNFSDESILGKAGREVQEQLSGIWIHENAELAGITKGEVETIKAFASRQIDRARPAYARCLVEQARHSIEVGTTNDTKYLLSPTGNRRFWPLAVTRSIDLSRLRAARQQLWGEAAHYQSQGEALTLDEALWGAAGVEQEERRVQHPWEAKLAAMTVRPEVDPTGGWGKPGGAVIHAAQGVQWEHRVTTLDIFEHVLNIPAGQQHNGHAKTVASIMRMQGWTQKPFLLDGKTVRGYVRTDITADYSNGVKS